jgi:hypothetical protein
VAEGLAVKRDTAEKREAAEQAMKLQRLVNAGKSTKANKGFLGTSTGESMLKFVEGASGKDGFTGEQIDLLLTRAYGADAVAEFRTALGSQATAGGTPDPTQTVDPVETADVPEDFVIVDGETAYIGNTPINKDENGIWRDPEGNNRNNG